MRFFHTTLVAIAAITIAACTHKKKSTASTQAPAPVTSPAPEGVASGPMFPAPRPNDGVFAPGNEELLAIQAKHSDVTLQTLKEGHAIYTGVCTNCHAPKSIYSRAEIRWPGIIANMATMAKLTEIQKDAVYKYVMAIKATQPKGQN